jgi:hypothetical protein
VLPSLKFFLCMDQPVLCERCKLLKLDTLQEYRWGYILHPQVATLKKEAESEGACHICSLVWQSLRYDHIAILENDAAPVRLFLNPTGTHIDIAVTTRDGLEFIWIRNLDDEPYHLGPPDHRDGLFRARLTLYRHQGMYYTLRLQVLQVSSNSNQALGRLKGVIKHRPRYGNFESDDCFRMAQSWLDHCLKHHGKTCKQDKAVEPPSRLVDVGSLDGSVAPRLIITAKENISKYSRVKYAALSYRWGKVPFLKATVHNIQALMMSIP